MNAYLPSTKPAAAHLARQEIFAQMQQRAGLSGSRWAHIAQRKFSLELNTETWSERPL